MAMALKAKRGRYLSVFIDVNSVEDVGTMNVGADNRPVREHGLLQKGVILNDEK